MADIVVIAWNGWWTVALTLLAIANFAYSTYCAHNTRRIYKQAQAVIADLQARQVDG